MKYKVTFKDGDADAEIDADNANVEGGWWKFYGGAGSSTYLAAAIPESRVGRVDRLPSPARRRAD
jgi:hypothetical protein